MPAIRTGPRIAAPRRVGTDPPAPGDRR